MEFQEFCKKFKHMCNSIGCKECGIDKIAIDGTECECVIIKKPEQAEQIVEQWAKEYPVATNRDKFREVFEVDIAIVSGLLNEEWLNQEYKEPEENS